MDKFIDCYRQLTIFAVLPFQHCVGKGNVQKTSTSWNIILLHGAYPTLTSVITDPPPPSISRHLTTTTTSLSQRYQRAMIQLPPSPPLDPWASFDDDDEKPEVIGDDIPAAGPSQGKTPPHPLHSNDRLHVNHDRNGSLDVLGDVSRPALMRLTSETERQVAESSRSGSERGSLDLLRMSTSNAGAGAEEVEVLIHKVSQT